MPNPNGAVAGNSQNIPEAQTPRTRSTFPLHYHLFNTHRFGELIPHYVEDLVKGDVLPIRSSHQLRSYTLDSPLLQNVKRNKDYFLVPMEAILPFNWEKFFDNPVRGDDVLDDVGPSVLGFWQKAVNMHLQLYAALCGGTSQTGILPDSNTTNELALQASLRYMIILEYFYSNGNLLSSLGCHGAPYLRYDFGARNISFDTYFDLFITEILSHLNSSAIEGNFVFSVDGYSYTVVSDPKRSPGDPDRKISLRHALQLMRDNPTFVVTAWNGVSAIRTPLLNLFSPPSGTNFAIHNVGSNGATDLSRLWAYQLCCAHYMSNDHIDFVYSAELFRDMIGSYLNNFSSYVQTFTRNGIKYRYDYLSAHACSYVFTAASSNASNLLTANTASQSPGPAMFAILGYFSALLGYRRSLRYVDYFTGSRAQPLAVASSTMNTNVAVNNNQVSVIDITKSIQAQRFLNAVNHVRHSFEGYLKGVFGGKLPAPDYHNPFYLAHTDDVIFGQETENTGAAQMVNGIAITTNLRSNSGNYVFEIQADRPAIAIGISSYEITRVYSKSTERSFFKLNRFDWFNPFLQYIGDQQVYLDELGINPLNSSNVAQLGLMTTFGYSIRHEEYKQRYSQAAGGFVENLPGWIFLASDLRGNQANINPDWIRSLNAEFDQFYISLNGWSLGSYFHFIVDDFNSVNASRPMAYAPTIL